MAVDYFLKLDGIPGESTDAKHKGEIDVLAFSWGVSQSGSTAPGGGVATPIGAIARDSSVFSCSRRSKALSRSPCAKSSQSTLAGENPITVWIVGADSSSAEAGDRSCDPSPRTATWWCPNPEPQGPRRWFEAQR